MPPEGVNTLSISSGVHGTALVIRAIGELDYDFAPIFRRRITQIWSMSASDPSPLSSELLTPPSGASPLSPPPETPSPLSSGISSPLSPATPSPLSPESPSPLSPATPSPLSPETPSPLSPESPSPFSPATPSPLSPESPSPLSPEPPVTPAPLSAGPAPPLEAPSGMPIQAGTVPWLILDLTELTFCDSTGIAELLWILHRSQETGTRLVLAGASRTLRHMLTTTGLLPYFTMSASVEAALEEGEIQAS
ncbi:STAS domain-containing protein [Streptosporangium lutulentum]